MLDKRSLYLLNFIIEQCDGVGYKVFTFDELLSCFSERVKCSAQDVRDSLSALSIGEYISVKYEDENEVCACPLSKGRSEVERVKGKVIETKTQNKQHFLYSFLGGTLGGIIAVLITLFALLLGGV